MTSVRERARIRGVPYWEIEDLRKDYARMIPREPRPPMTCLGWGTVWLLPPSLVPARAKVRAVYGCSLAEES